MAYLRRFSVIRLRLSESSGVTPVSRVPLRGRTDFGSGSGPEPAVDVLGLEIRSVATGEVALPARGPDVPDVAPGYPLLDELVLLGRLQGDGVHAVSPADVPGV